MADKIIEMTIENYFNKTIEHIRTMLPKVQEDIASSKDSDEWERELFEQFSLPLIEELQEPSGEFINQEEDVQDYGRSISVEFVYFQVEWKFHPAPRLEFSLNLRSNPHNTMLPKTDLLMDNSLRFAIKIGTSTQLDQDHIQQSAQGKIDGAISSFRAEIGHKNRNIDLGNNLLRLAIKEGIGKRKEAVSKKKEALEKLGQRITVKLNKKTEHLQIIPLTPRPIAQKPPIQTGSIPKQELKEYTIKREDFLKFLGYIDRYLKSCERTPIPFNTLEEEHIRDLMLPYLNQVFESATGETFSKQGKTDIHLVVQEGCIVICECKWWTGADSIEVVVQQVLKRVTWRENYGVVMVFVKNKNISKVIEQAEELIKNHSSNVGKEIKQLASHHFSSKNLRTDDKGCVEIHYFFYNFPPKS